MSARLRHAHVQTAYGANRPWKGDATHGRKSADWDYSHSLVSRLQRNHKRTLELPTSTLAIGIHPPGLGEDSDGPTSNAPKSPKGALKPHQKGMPVKDATEVRPMAVVVPGRRHRYWARGMPSTLRKPTPVPTEPWPALPKRHVRYVQRTGSRSFPDPRSARRSTRQSA